MKDKREVLEFSDRMVDKMLEGDVNSPTQVRITYNNIENECLQAVEEGILTYDDYRELIEEIEEIKVTFLEYWGIGVDNFNPL